MRSHRVVSVRASLAVVLALALSACAHLSLKSQAVSGLEATEVALKGARIFEQQLYDAKSLPQLTPQKHADINRLLGKAFLDQIAAANALKAWRAGEPTPTDLVSLQQDADQVLAVVKGLLPSGGPLVDRVQVVLDEVLKVLQLVKS